MDPEATVWWPKNRSVYCAFNDLFTNAMSVRSIPADAQVYKHWFFAISNEMTKLNPWKCGPFDFQYHSVDSFSKKRILDAIQILEPLQDLLEKAKQYEALLPSNAISVQVRSWPEYPPRQSNFDIEKYFSVLDKHEDAYLFVTGDSPECVLELYKRYGARRIISTHHRTRQGDRWSVSGMQDIFIDFLVASKCNYMVGSAGSTFTELSWWWGGAKAEIELVDC